MNIINKLSKEIEEGRTKVNNNGECITPDKMNESMRKKYLADIKSEKIDFTKVSYETFVKEESKKYFDTSFILGIFRGILDGEAVPEVLNNIYGKYVDTDSVATEN